MNDADVRCGKILKIVFFSPRTAKSDKHGFLNASDPSAPNQIAVRVAQPLFGSGPFFIR